MNADRPDRAAGKLDHFSVLDLPPAFDLDPDALEQRFHQLQKHWHPDRRSASNPDAPPDTGAQADQHAQVSARLNEAYRQLRSPVGRALCLLGRLDVATTESSTSLNAEQLQQQFALRGQLEDSQHSEQMDALRDQAKALLAASSRIFAAAWEQADRLLAEQSYQQMLFTDRFITAINEREDQLLEEGT